jgi:2-polyprenyl-3-methyl-5-hydroxy-6-metoxy-1,4-benzoquinol methylase
MAVPSGVIKPTLKPVLTPSEDLDLYLSNYTNFNDWLIRHRYEHLKQFFKGKTCLELGPAHGEGTEYLLKYFDEVMAVDGSAAMIKTLEKRFSNPKLQTLCAYFEDFKLPKKYDTVVLAHILEHVDDPQTVLAHAKKYLKPGGVMIVDVPNGLSLHRQVGVKMGMLDKVTDLNEADLSIGHKRVYTPQTFQEEFKKAGLKIVEFGGMFTKILSNSQTEKVFDENQLQALMAVGIDNPEIAAEIFVVATA